MEGTKYFKLQKGSNTSHLVKPIYEYTHKIGKSISGGYVYRGENIPEIYGHYFFADYVVGKIWSFKYVDGQVTEFTDWTDVLVPADRRKLSVSSFGEDADGELYICDHAFGRVFKIVPVE